MHTCKAAHVRESMSMRTCLDTQRMPLPVLGIIPSMIGALKDAAESVMKIYEEFQKYKAMVQEKMDAVKSKIEELKKTTQYERVKQFMDENEKVLGWAQKAAIVFGPHIANAAVEKVASRMDAHYQKKIVTEYELIEEERKADEEAPAPRVIISSMVYPYPAGGPPMYMAGFYGPYGPVPPMTPPVRILKSLQSLCTKRLLLSRVFNDIDAEKRLAAQCSGSTGLLKSSAADGRHPSGSVPKASARPYVEIADTVSRGR